MYSINILSRYIFPHTTDENGQLPLHIAAGTDTYIKLSFEKRQKSPLLHYLLDANVSGVRTLDCQGRLPIHYAVETEKSWIDGGLRELFQAEPRALRSRDAKTGLFPFMVFATLKRPRSSYKERRSRAERRARGKFPYEWNQFSNERRESELEVMIDMEQLDELSSLYQLIRLTPDLIISERKRFGSDI